MDELTEAVNLALDRVKADNGFHGTGEYHNGEAQLAKHLGINRQMLWRLRKGQFSREFRTLMPITVMVNTPLPPGAIELAQDIRILAPILSIPQIDA